MGDFIDDFFSSQPKPAAPERRKEIRADLTQFVELRFDQEVFGNATTMDISAEGIRVRSSKPMEPGSCVFLMFTLPGSGQPGGDSPPVQVQGEYIVLHCDPLGPEWKIGLRVYNLPGNSKARIKEFLERDS